MKSLSPRTTRKIEGIVIESFNDYSLYSIDKYENAF